MKTEVQVKNSHDLKSALRFLQLLEEEIREAQSLQDLQNKAILDRLAWARETLMQTIIGEHVVGAQDFFNGTVPAIK